MKVEASQVLFLLIWVFLPRSSEQSSFEDERCVCVCPKALSPNGTGPVYVKMVSPNNCLCKNVVPHDQSSIETDICHFCTCKYENRNTTTIKVVVIFIICVVTLLFIYMVFLMCLDPLIQHRPPSYSRHTDEQDDAMSIQSPPSGAVTSTETARAAVFSRQRSILNRVTTEQQKWKGTVQEQRKNIYDRHNMLN